MATARSTVDPVLKWEDPPADGRSLRGGGVGSPDMYMTLARELKERPGQWRRIFIKHSSSNAANTASRINGGKLTAFRPVGSFEAVSRLLRDGHGAPLKSESGKNQYGVWAKFVGPDED